MRCGPRFLVAPGAAGHPAVRRPHFQHWLTITLVLTLQPFYAGTWQRALERIGGTALGGLLAAVVALVCTTPLSIAAALFPLAVLAFAVRGVNYGAFMILLTPLVVLLTEFSRPGTGELFIAFERALYTLTGGSPGRPGRPGAVAELGAGAPAAGPRRCPGRPCGLRRSGVGGPAETGRTRHRRPGPARSGAGQQQPGNVDLPRPRRTARRAAKQGLQEAMVADAALRRMAGRLSALQLDPHHADGVSPDGLRAWRDWIRDAFRALRDGTGLPRSRPDGRAPDALVRIALQIELLDGALHHPVEA